MQGKFKTVPYAHQLDYLNKYGRYEAFALLDEMGAGKTKSIIDNVADLWASNDCDALLIFAPNGVHSNWTRIELDKHMPDWVRWKARAWCAPTSKKDKAEFEEIYSVEETGQLRILSMNWEALQSKRGADEAFRFAKCAQNLMIVCDESDSIKNPTAARTKVLMKLKPYSKWRRIMSGTPINNAPFDAFSQFSFLDESILGTTSFYAFKAEYAEMLQDGNPLLDSIKQKSGSRFTPQVVARGAGGRPKYKNLEKLSKLIAPYSRRMLKTDCLDLPDKIYKTIVFDLTKEQKAVYDKAKEECRLVFESEETPFNKLVAAMKLAQITSGYYIHPLAETAVRIQGDNPKLDLLHDRVTKIVENGDKVIIWARYKIEIDDIVSRLRKHGHHVVQYNGDTKKDERIEAIEAFQNGDATVFVGNQQAGGTGITLTAASHVIYFSNNFSLRDRLQSEDRAHRIGQTKNVIYTNIVAKNTIDEAVVEALSNKKDVADTIIDKGLKLFS